MKYKLLRNNMTNELAKSVLRTTDNTYIPFDPDNTSYQEYLEWIAEGNTPEEAE